MNNSVKNSRGEIVGFRCSQCDEIKSKMWGTVCNTCRDRANEAAKLREEIAELRKVIELQNKLNK